MQLRTARNIVLVGLAITGVLTSIYQSRATAPGSSIADWPMWGGSADRNMVNLKEKLDIDFEPVTDAKTNRRQRNVAWTAKLGSQTYGNPVIAANKVFVGTNNGGKYRPHHDGDRGCVLAFDAQTGTLLWQLTREKLPQGRVNDWPEQGICSTACVDGDRMWLVTNRAELICLDTEGFLDDQNDGPTLDEADHARQDADIIWTLDMIDELGVFPHNLATSSPVVFGDLVFVITSNGVEETHKQVVLPRAPSFIAVNKRTGAVVWECGLPYDKILHGQWSSPTLGKVNGKMQVFFGGGDGWLYSLDPATGELIWKFDLNPKESEWILNGRGTRNNIVSTPVFFDNSIILAVGQDPDHLTGVGHLYRIDATKQGDVSPHFVVDENGRPVDLPRGEPADPELGQRIVTNPNSAMIWHYGGVDQEGEFVFGRTMSTAAVHDGLVYMADLAGFVYCLDFKTGRRQWRHDMLAGCWGSPMVVDGKVLIGDEYGDLRIFAAGRRERLLRTIEFGSSIYSTPSLAYGKLFVASRSTLYAIGKP